MRAVCSFSEVGDCHFIYQIQRGRVLLFAGCMTSSGSDVIDNIFQIDEIEYSETSDGLTTVLWWFLIGSRQLLADASAMRIQGE